ncbi:MAG TPA: hypothetical protein OIM45_07170 [Clostridiaceae bacterium]|nr:hypothetical protein [Clostridiaceae bacterium]
MANIMQAYAKYKDNQNRKIAEFKELISKVIEEFMNATEKFSERDDLTELFIEWNYSLNDDPNIFIRENENGTMKIWEQVTEPLLSNAYLYVYNKNVFEEMNTFLEKAFPWLGLRITANACLTVTEDGISIELVFESREDILSIVPEHCDAECYVVALRKAMVTLLEQTGAQTDDNGDEIYAMYHLN